MSVMDRFKLVGRTALITGGSRGLGKVFAQTLAEAGAEIVIVSRNAEINQRTADELSRMLDRKVHSFVCDVTKSEQVLELKKCLFEHISKIDIIVHSAGLNIRGPIDQLSVEDWDSVVDANLKAPFLINRLFGPGMASNGWGRIIHLGSILSAIGISGRTPYASSKAGLLGLTRTLAMEWAKNGVTVNALCPGPFKTDMNLELLNDPVKFQEFVSKIPMGRWGELEELKGPLLYLASDACSYMTGQTLYIDGGWTAQ